MIKVLERNVSKQEVKDFLYYGMSIEDKHLYQQVNESQANIFQFSGGTASGMIQRAIPTNFEELTCLNALSRPGSSYEFDDFVNNGTSSSKYPKIIAEKLEDSHGCILFQEQIINLTNKFTDRTLNHFNDYIKEIITCESGEDVVEVETEAGTKYFLPYEIIKTKSGDKYAKDLSSEDELA